ALERLPVDLEEQPLVGPECGVGEPAPERAAQVLERGVRRQLQVPQGIPLLLLDRPDDLHEQALLGAEVVDQHPVAGAGGRGELAQADVGDAIGGHVLDGRVEQPVLGIHRVEPYGTCTIWFMHRHHIEQTAHTTADPASVYALLRDGATWPAWGPIESFELE